MPEKLSQLLPVLGAIAAFLFAAFLLLLIFRLLFGRKVRAPGPRNRPRRLDVVDVFDVDRDRQLVIVRRDNIEHLLMIGGPNDVLVESAINRVEAALGRPGDQRQATANWAPPRELDAAPAQGQPPFAPPKAAAPVNLPPDLFAPAPAKPIAAPPKAVAAPPPPASAGPRVSSPIAPPAAPRPAPPRPPTPPFLARTQRLAQPNDAQTSPPPAAAAPKPAPAPVEAPKPAAPPPPPKPAAVAPPPPPKPAAPPPPPAPKPAPAASSPPTPAPSERAEVDPLDSLEAEMARLLGRPDK